MKTTPFLEDSLRPINPIYIQRTAYSPLLEDSLKSFSFFLEDSLHVFLINPI